MSEEKSALKKVADALMGEKKPNPMSKYVNGEMPKNPPPQRPPRTITTTGVRG